jgi:hypothetical protein
MTLDQILLIIALVLAVAAGVGQPATRFNLLALSFAVFIVTLLTP